MKMHSIFSFFNNFFASMSSDCKTISNQSAACYQTESLRLFFTGIFISTLTRLVLCVLCFSQVISNPLVLLLSFLSGFIQDVMVVGLLCLPVAFYLTILPPCKQATRWNHNLLLVWTFLLNVAFILNAVAEVAFWIEFESRYNFIAVDYLAYTTEVLGNMWESYPIIPIFIGVFGVSAVLSFLQRTKRKAAPSPETYPSKKQRVKFLFGSVCVILVAIMLYKSATSQEFFNNTYHRELAKNGMEAFVYAFIHNQLDYEQFYKTASVANVDKLLRQELSRDGSTFVSNDLLDIRRTITGKGTPKKWNVILVLEESLSASFIGVLDSEKQSLTPNFDELSTQGMLLDRCFASGTRTVRGIEAVELAIPPTPGQSIVKRRDHADLFSMGHLFRENGYSNTFIYGGKGFFDNMNAFFEQNGYDIQDSTSPLSVQDTFSNAWGHCDEDVFDWALDAADRSYATGLPFHQFILTTSNHRPYTFPEGRIDAEQGHRSSAVRYSDYALKQFIEKAKAKPWFDNTLFVIVADHCHSTSGRTTLPLNKYHIPALFYAPALIQPSRCHTVCSQIDIAPTIFGLMNWTYVSEFYGMNITHDPLYKGRAFPGTFQNLGYLDGETGELTTLLVKKRQAAEIWSLENPFEITQPLDASTQIDKVIAIYQSASVRYAKRLDKVFQKK